GPAGRHVEIMQHQGLCELRLLAEGNRNVAGIDDVAEGADVGRLERQFRDHGHPVIALLSVQRDVLIAEPLEALAWKCVVDAFGFLQAQHVGPRALQEPGDEIDAQPHRIDVPGCQGKPHASRVISRFVSLSSALSTTLWWANPTGRAPARPMAGSACTPDTACTERWARRLARLRPPDASHLQDQPGGSA